VLKYFYYLPTPIFKKQRSAFCRWWNHTVPAWRCPGLPYSFPSNRSDGRWTLPLCFLCGWTSYPGIVVCDYTFLPESSASALRFSHALFRWEWKDIFCKQEVRYAFFGLSINRLVVGVKCSGGACIQSRNENVVSSNSLPAEILPDVSLMELMNWFWLFIGMVLLLKWNSGGILALIKFFVIRCRKLVSVIKLFLLLQQLTENMTSLTCGFSF